MPGLPISTWLDIDLRVADIVTVLESVGCRWCLRLWAYDRCVMSVATSVDTKTRGIELIRQVYWGSMYWGDDVSRKPDIRIRE